MDAARIAVEIAGLRDFPNNQERGVVKPHGVFEDKFMKKSRL